MQLPITVQENTDQFAELTESPTITLALWKLLVSCNWELENAQLLLGNQEKDNVNTARMFTCLLVESRPSPMETVRRSPSETCAILSAIRDLSNTLENAKFRKLLTFLDNAVSVKK